MAKQGVETLGTVLAIYQTEGDATQMVSAAVTVRELLGNPLIDVLIR